MKRGSRLNKLLDRYLGIPILLLLKPFKSKRVLPKNIKSVGILTVPAMGDILLLKGLLDDILGFDRQIKINLFSNEENRELIKLICTEAEFLSINNFKFLSTIKTIKKNRFDVFIDTSQWSRFNALITMFSKSKFTVGFKTRGQFKHILFDKAIDHRSDIHEVYNLKNLAFDKQIITSNLPKINLNVNGKPDIDYAVIHLKPGGYLSYLREWHESSWKEIVKYILNKNIKVFFTGSKDDRASIDKFIGEFSNKTMLENAAGKLSFTALANLLQKSKIVLCINTGVMHLASLLDCNLIALHGPTNPDRWGPLSENAIVIKSDHPEAPCLNLGFEYNCSDRTGECMKKISTTSVIKAIDELLIKY